MGWFADRKAKKAEFLRQLRYGNDISEEWTRAKTMIAEGGELKHQLEKQIEKSLGLDLKYPQYITVDDYRHRSIDSAPNCERSIVGYHVTLREISDNWCEKHQCLFCGAEV